jgi:FkbM family methyltransferase
MESFVFNDRFRKKLRQDAHRYGEVLFLESVLRRGMTVIEGGAHSGITTIATARAVGKNGYVYAFEPVTDYFAYLQANISANGTNNISAINLALSDKTGIVQFYKHGEGSGVTAVDNAEKIHVYATTVCQFINMHGASLDFINLDCEGSELLVLRGARDVLETRGPSIFCEVHHDYLKELNQSVSDIVRFLRTLAYAVKPIQVEDLKIQSNFERCSHIYANKKNRH